jgi:hypothetical protein
MLGRCFSFKVKSKKNKKFAIAEKPSEPMMKDGTRSLLRVTSDGLKIPACNKSSRLSIVLLEYPRLGSIYNEKNDFDSFRLVPFLDQSIQAIRAKKQAFDDGFFLKYIDSIVENPASLLFISLKSRLGSVADLKELNKLIKWERTQVRFLTA